MTQKVPGMQSPFAPDYRSLFHDHDETTHELPPNTHPRLLGTLFKAYQEIPLPKKLELENPDEMITWGEGETKITVPAQLLYDLIYENAIKDAASARLNPDSHINERDKANILFTYFEKLQTKASKSDLSRVLDFAHVQPFFLVKLAQHNHGMAIAFLKSVFKLIHFLSPQ